MFRGLYYGSYASPREVLWCIGVVIRAPWIGKKSLSILNLNVATACYFTYLLGSGSRHFECCDCFRCAACRRNWAGRYRSSRRCSRAAAGDPKGPLSAFLLRLFRKKQCVALHLHCRALPALAAFGETRDPVRLSTKWTSGRARGGAPKGAIAKTLLPVVTWWRSKHFGATRLFSIDLRRPRCEKIPARRLGCCATPGALREPTCASTDSHGLR